MGRKVIVRTCRVDGISWWVPDHLRRPRKPGLGERMMASGERLTSARTRAPAGRGATARLGQMEQNYTEGTRLAYCPVCGGSRWSEAKSRQMPPSLDVQLAARAAQAYQAQYPTAAYPPPPPPPSAAYPSS